MPDFIRGLQNIRSHHQNCAITIGNFDGVHRGHQQLLNQLAMYARQHHLSTLLITFEPHPQEYFNSQAKPARLTSLREKIVCLNTLPLDYILCLPFDKGLVNLSATDFVNEILIKRLQIKYLLVGDDFRFGHDRQGDFSLLQQAGKVHHFNVERQDTILLEGERVSSTRIRSTLKAGDLALAKYLLGRPYCMCGRVTYGDQRGRLLGFPTANIDLCHRVPPLWGVFAVKVRGTAVLPQYPSELKVGIYPSELDLRLGAKRANRQECTNKYMTAVSEFCNNASNPSTMGMANIGTRPTLGHTHTLLEVHLFDFNGTIYGKYIEIEFVKKLRDEKRFADLNQLKHQLSQDAKDARDSLINSN